MVANFQEQYILVLGDKKHDLDMFFFIARINFAKIVLKKGCFYFVALTNFFQKFV